jgi:hypothetical protein
VATFKYKLVRQIHVAVHSTASPSDDEWRAYLDNIQEWLRRIDGIFSFTVGGGPNARQREAAVQFWRQQPRQPPIAVVTPSLLVVRMAGALSWFMPSQIKAFTPRNVGKAYDYLKLASEQRAAVENGVRVLAREQNLAELEGIRVG